jgi:steroid delta-isomerase-like uncharacterized protein
MANTFSVEAWYAAISSHKFERILAFLAPDIRYEDVPTGTVSEGPEAVREFFRRTWSAIPDMKMVSGHTLQTAGGVAAEWVTTGTHLGDFPGLPATGNAFHVRGISMIELGDDGVRRVSDYWDLAGSGLLPMPGGGAGEEH